MVTVIRRQKDLFCARRSAVLSPNNVVRISLDHIKIIEKLVTELSYELFGNFDLEEVITKSCICLAVEDDAGTIGGVVAIHIHPNVPAVPPWEWENWLSSLYGVEGSTCRNTLWIRLVLWDDCYYKIFLRPIVQYIFKMLYFLKFVIMVIPPGAQEIDFLDNMGTRVLPKDHYTPNECQTLYLLQRQSFVLQYKIRRAVEEDNDDLVPLIDQYSERLKEMYGSYYIAEILTRHKDSGRQIIVAEYQGQAVAVLCLNETLNYKVLNEEFELTPFNGLKKPHSDDYAEISLDVISRSLEQLRIQNRVEEEVTQIIEKYSFFTSQSSLNDPDLLKQVSATSSDEYSLVFTSASIFFFQDDEDRYSQIMISSIDSQEMEDYENLRQTGARIIQEDQLSRNRDSTTKGKWMTKIPDFKGEPNGFSLEIAASHPDHEYGLILLFEASFECFPDRDYCVMSIPTTVAPNKLTKYFGRVVPRPDGTFPLELYVVHKNAILSTISAKIATMDHDKQIKYLLSTIPNNHIILTQLENYFKREKNQYYAFVLLTEDQVIGVAILSEEFDVDYLQAKYDLLSSVNPKLYRSGMHGLVENIVMSPIFQGHSKFFLREIHRLSDFAVLYYKQTPYDTKNASRERPLLNFLQNLLPILPRQQPMYDLELLKSEECAPSAAITQDQDPFALYISTVPLSSVNRLCINTKIVVVGCSHTSLAFLESLILTQNPNYMVTFNNVTLVCQNGFSYTKITSKIRDAFLVKKNFMDARHMDMISLKTYVNIVQGTMTKIDRKEQYIVVNDSSFLPYDLLFLMCGEQFQKPLRANVTPFVERPENVFIINNAIDANNAVTKLKNLYGKFADPKNGIIIYGHCLQAYCTLNGLLAYGIPGSHIVFVEPFPYSMTIEKRHRHNVSVFNDPDVDQAVLDQIKAEGIKVYSSFYFMDWLYDDDDNIITMVRFESRHLMLEMECMAMFFFNEKSISPTIYQVINDAGLVFDGRLVIDSNCQTNDPKIFGAGTLTKYSRKYYASHMIHKYFNRVEIGHRLGLQIKNMLIPIRAQNIDKKRGWNFNIERGDSLVPRYEKPIMRYCMLPGGLYYLSVVKPGRKTPLETAISEENYGQVLITGSCQNLNSQGFFRLHLDEFKRVETITCLTKFPIDIYNIYSIWGKHQKLLNNLQLRFEMVLITDFFEYFKEPWAYMIYHDRFEALMDDLNMLMTSTVGPEAEAVVDDLIDMYKMCKWKQLTPDMKKKIEQKFSALSYNKIIEQKVLDFLKANLDYLPMYAHPVVVRSLLEGYYKSPMFSK